MSVDIEAIMYEYARKVGITLFTVSHRYGLLRPPQVISLLRRNAERLLYVTTNSYCDLTVKVTMNLESK